jgi:hypothetical protein
MKRSVLLVCMAGVLSISVSACGPATPAPETSEPAATVAPTVAVAPTAVVAPTATMPSPSPTPSARKDLRVGLEETSGSSS